MTGNRTGVYTRNLQLGQRMVPQEVAADHPKQRRGNAQTGQPGGGVHSVPAQAEPDLLHARQRARPG